MKAILKVHKDNQYSKYNGLTFEITNVTHNGVDLDINNVDTFFTFKEILIVNIQNELVKECKKHAIGEQNHTSKLERYIQENEITVYYF